MTPSTDAAGPLPPQPDAAPPETAAAHMVTSFPRATMGAKVSTIIEELRGQTFECADAVFVTDRQGRLEGIVRINDLIAADADQAIREVVEPRHEAVHPEDDQEQMAILAMEAGMIAVPVVDDDHRLIGAVPAEALMRILHREHMEDLQRLAGITRDNARGRIDLEAPLGSLIVRRMPWLIIGLVASAAATAVVAAFEHTLNANVAVAFFVPALVYIAGAIGTQAVSVAIRALSYDETAGPRLMWRELAVGLAVGLFLALLALPPVYLVFGDAALAFAVSSAIFGAGALSAMVGFGLPWFLQRLGFDPALGSGPVCTIIQDVASLSIYFLVVSALVL